MMGCGVFGQLALIVFVINAVAGQLDQPLPPPSLLDNLGMGGPRLNPVTGVPDLVDVLAPSANGGGMGGGVPQSSMATCSWRESQTLFRNCLVSFGMAHLPLFPYFRSQPTCPARDFNCRAVDTMVKCVNKQPVNVISNECWSNIKQTLSQAFHRYRIPCTYDDMYNACWQVSDDILPLSQRSQRRGRNFSNNPLGNIVLQLYMQGNLGHALGI